MTDSTNTNIIGQQEIIDHLLLLDREDRVPHAMLFVGEQGVGKMAVAIEFAKHMLKKHDPNGNAEAMIERGSHPDLIYSYPVVRPAGSDRPAEILKTNLLNSNSFTTLSKRNMSKRAV